MIKFDQNEYMMISFIDKKIDKIRLIALTAREHHINQTYSQLASELESLVEQLRQGEHKK